MTLKHLTTALVVAALLLIGGRPAEAARPLDVDCNLLASTIDAVDAFLDGLGQSPDNVGDLIAEAILDEVAFDQLNALVMFFSVGQISFTSAPQAVSTTAKCGLLPRLIGNIRD